MAGEQSCGTFTRVANETDELRERAAATVVDIEKLDTAETPALRITSYNVCYTKLLRFRGMGSWPFWVHDTTPS